MKRKRLGDLLVESNIISSEQLATALKEKLPEEKLGDTLLREGYITEQQLIEVLEFQLGIPHINIFQYPIDQNIVQLVPQEIAKRDRKSTRLNSSHVAISYAVFCLKKTIR